MYKSRKLSVWINELINSIWHSRTNRRISSHAEGRPRFARMYTCEASASRAANVHNAAHGPDPMIKIPLGVVKRKEWMREAAVRGLRNFGGGYMRTISIVLRFLKTRQAVWGTLEVVICATSEICQLVPVLAGRKRERPKQTLINIVLNHHHLHQL